MQRVQQCPHISLESVVVHPLPPRSLGRVDGAECAGSLEKACLVARLDDAYVEVEELISFQVFDVGIHKSSLTGEFDIPRVGSRGVLRGRPAPEGSYVHRQGRVRPTDLK